jgi:hypothetical protein
MSVALRVATLLGVALALARCGRSETYRYKLTPSLAFSNLHVSRRLGRAHKFW